LVDVRFAPTAIKVRIARNDAMYQTRKWRMQIVTTKKPLEGGFSNSNLMIVNQAAINTGFPFVGRR